MTLLAITQSEYNSTYNNILTAVDRAAGTGKMVRPVIHIICEYTIDQEEIVKKMEVAFYATITLTLTEQIQSQRNEMGQNNELNQIVEYSSQESLVMNCMLMNSAFREYAKKNPSEINEAASLVSMANEHFNLVIS